jgi:hypothetical protein
MDKAKLIETVARVRRAMPRNMDVMEVCGALESYLRIVGGGGKRFDRKVWMREYMRNYMRGYKKRKGK